mgnify:FL=1|jgi:hypothetical protein
MSDDILQSEESIQFFSLIHMLQRSALIGLGLMPGSEGGFQANLDEAKAAIDLIGVLQKRTQGNLEEVEKTLLQTILSELRMQFVQAPKEVERKQAEQEAAEELKQTFEDPKSASVETLIDDDEGSDSEE